jgi:hypothetical protein
MRLVSAQVTCIESVVAFLRRTLKALHATARGCPTFVGLPRVIAHEAHEP